MLEACPPPPMSPHVHLEFVAPRPGGGRCVTDVGGWGAHRAQLRCPDDVSGDMCERGVPGRALNPSSTSYPDHGRCGDLLLQKGKFPRQNRESNPGPHS
jgi:hypothetical protein